MDEINKKLLENIKNSISETVKEKKIGIAFSGGVDSTLISKILFQKLLKKRKLELPFLDLLIVH